MDIYDNAKREYDEYIYLCTRTFAKVASWWFMPSSSRERFGTEVQAKYFEFIKRNEITAKIQSFEKRSLGRKSLTELLRFFKKIFNFIRLFSVLFFYSSIGRMKSCENAELDFDIVFVRPIHPLKFNQNKKQYFDHYFGELPKIAEQFGLKVGILGPPDPSVFWNSDISKYGNIEISNLLKYFSASSFFQWLLISIREYFLKLSFPQGASINEKYLHKLLTEEFRNSYINRLWGFTYYLSFSNFLCKNKEVIVFHTYENNTWEHAIDLACQDNPLKVKRNIGFLHCAILESHRKYKLLNDEWGLKPGPSEILVTGPNAKSILLEFGEYDSNSIKVGFDLRGPNLNSISPGGQRVNTKIETILILLEGLNTMPPLLELSMNAIQKVFDKKLIVRCHPVYPITNSAFDSVKKNPFFSKIQISKDTSLQEDLSKADLVIYKGSTSALYAAYMGIPLLRFRDDWWSSDDPLKYCSSLKKEFSDSRSLLDGVVFFENMDALEFETQKKNLRDYVRGYMRPYEPEDLERYMRDLLQTGRVDENSHIS